MASERLNSLQDLLEHEIKDLYSAETQLIDALPEMAKAASNPKLKKAFEDHLRETENQLERLNQVAKTLKLDPKGETCAAMKGLIKEGKDMIKMKGEENVKDAGLIASAQRIEHYEIAGYGAAHTYAQQLDFKDAAKLLEETLKEEKNTDTKLNKLALANINKKAEKA
jgi:ferritin-like metal-binding protein YciE